MIKKFSDPSRHRASKCQNTRCLKYYLSRVICCPREIFPYILPDVRIMTSSRISLSCARNRSFCFQEHVFLTFRSRQKHFLILNLVGKVVRGRSPHSTEGSKLLMTVCMHLHQEFPLLTLIDNFTMPERDAAA